MCVQQIVLSYIASEHFIENVHFCKANARTYHLHSKEENWFSLIVKFTFNIVKTYRLNFYT
jgi:hypothetical protein